MRVLITGGLGFIGSHTVERFVKEGNEVFVADNGHTGFISNLGTKMFDRIEGFAHNISEAIERFRGLDVIIHMGMPSSSPMYKQHPLFVASVVEDSLRLLEHAKNEEAKFILISTSSLYNGNPVPYHENMPVYVTDYYTEARYYAERLCELYSRLHGLKCVALRLFSVYGEREEHKGRYANMLTQFIWKAITNSEAVIYGDGSQTRDFIYVEDVVEAIVKAVEFDDYGDKRYEVFNVGTGVSYSFNDIVKKIEAITGNKIKIQYAPNTIKNYVHHTLADTRKAESMLGFKAKTTVDDGIKDIWFYYKQVFPFG